MGLILSLLGRAPKSLMGVNIGARRVKLLELGRSGSGFRVLAYANEAIPVDAVKNFQIVDPEAVSAALVRALERSGSRTRDAAVAVSGPAVISKTILMPAGMDDAEMEQQIRFDAAHHIPHPIEEVNLDFQVVEQDPDNPTFNRVVLVACRRDNIEMQTAALEMAGMQIHLVDVEEYALQNACQLLSPQMSDLGENPKMAVFDIGSENTRLTVQSGARNQYAREISLRGAELTDQLVRAYELTDTGELFARLRLGELRSEDGASLIEAFAERLATHVDRALSFYHSATSDSADPIDAVVITGPPTLCPGLDRTLADLLGWPVRLGNPLSGMPASAVAQRNHVDTDAPMLMVATGLALRGVA